MTTTLEVVKVLLGPCRVHWNYIGRFVEYADGSAQTQTWGAEGWEPGGCSVLELMESPSAPPEVLERFGVPPEEW